MKSHALYWPALIIAALGAAVVPISALDAPVRSLVLFPMTYTVSVTIAALFARICFDPACRRGIDAANKEIQGDHPFRFRWMMFDREWGLFGSREGPRSLQLVRVILAIEFVTAMIFIGGDILLLAAGSFAVTIALTLMHVALNTRATAEVP